MDAAGSPSERGLGVRGAGRRSALLPQEHPTPGAACPGDQAESTPMEEGVMSAGLEGQEKVVNLTQVLTLHGSESNEAAVSLLRGQEHRAENPLPPPPSSSSSSRSHRQSYDAQVKEARREGLVFDSRYPAWSNLCSPPLAVRCSPMQANSYHRSACLVSNGQSLIPALSRPLLCGSNMFRSGAYVHQYTSCGLEVDEFVTAFRSMGQIVSNYRSLST
jgi:hypothetical protein